MIPNLLWRCPICFTIDALREKRRWLKEDLLICSHCRREWTVTRRRGDTYYLRLLPHDAAATEDELPLWVWYERMKKDFEPRPLADRGSFLNEDEPVYLVGRPVKLVAQENNPRFFQQIKKASETTKKVYPFMRKVGKGDLFLTNRRLVWSAGERRFSFRFSEIDSVYIEIFHNLCLASETRICKFQFTRDSYLKWLTHIASLTEKEGFSNIYFSNY
jgi:hypothetical protein